MTAGTAPAITPATGRLGVLLVGLGAVASITSFASTTTRRGREYFD